MTDTATEAVARPKPTPAAQEHKPPASRKSEPSSAPGQTLGGVLVPGGALTGLIGLCWLTHQFGLPAVILAAVACSAVATTALVIRARRRMRRTRPPQLTRSPRTGHGPPLGRGNRLGSGGRSPAARSGTGSLASQGSRMSPAAAHRRGSVAASRKPGGLAAGNKKPLASAVNHAGAPSPALGRNAAALGGTGRRIAPGAASPRALRTPAGALAAQQRATAGSGAPASGAAGRLARLHGRKTAPAGGGRPLGASGEQQRGGIKGGNKARSASGAAPATKRAAKAAKVLGRAINRRRSQGKEPDAKRLKARPKNQTSLKKKSKASARKKRSGGKRARFQPTAPMNTLRRAQYWAGRKLRKHTSPQARRRLRMMAVPFRAGARVVARYGSPLLANAWRLGSRGLLRAHMALGSVRFSTMGPNWLRPLARVLHTLTTPAARVLAWTGTWGWLNRWMYRHTGGGTKPTVSRRPAAPGRRHTVHRPVHAPGTNSTAPAPKGVPVSSIEPALPLHYAADAVRTAGAMMMLNPAGNMVGYEATINSLAEIQRAIGDVIAMAAHSSRENFKVNPAIPDAYDDTAVYAHALAGRLDSIPTLYRIIHAEQIDNIENPTVQGAKWDQSANN